MLRVPLHGYCYLLMLDTFCDLDIVQKNLKLLIVAIIVISILPGVIEVIRHRRASAKAKKESDNQEV